MKKMTLSFAWMKKGLPLALLLVASTANADWSGHWNGQVRYQGTMDHSPFDLNCKEAYIVREEPTRLSITTLDSACALIPDVQGLRSDENVPPRRRVVSSSVEVRFTGAVGPSGRPQEI